MGVKPYLSGKEGFPPACISAPTMDTCPPAAAKCRGVRPLVSLRGGGKGEGDERGSEVRDKQRDGREGGEEGRRQKMKGEDTHIQR